MLGRLTLLLLTRAMVMVSETSLHNAVAASTPPAAVSLQSHAYSYTQRETYTHSYTHVSRVGRGCLAWRPLAVMHSHAYSYTHTRTYAHTQAQTEAQTHKHIHARFFSLPWLIWSGSWVSSGAGGGRVGPGRDAVSGPSGQRDRTPRPCSATRTSASTGTWADAGMACGRVAAGVCLPGQLPRYALVCLCA
jgi:hypothetical protein